MKMCLHGNKPTIMGNKEPLYNLMIDNDLFLLLHRVKIETPSEKNSPGKCLDSRQAYITTDLGVLGFVQ